MKTLAIDCRMARMSGIGVYLRNLAQRCMERMNDVQFWLLGYDGAFSTPSGCRWEAVPITPSTYGIAEQLRILPLLRGCDALWVLHYVIPVFSSLPVAVTVHDTAHLALDTLCKGVQRIYARGMFAILRHEAARP